MTRLMSFLTQTAAMKLGTFSSGSAGCHWHLNTSLWAKNRLVQRQPHGCWSALVASEGCYLFAHCFPVI